MNAQAIERIVGAIVTAGLAAYSVHESDLATKNQNENWSGREQLRQCHAERDKILERLIEQN